MRRKQNQWIKGAKIVASVIKGGAVTLQNIVKCIKYQRGRDN